MQLSENNIPIGLNKEPWETVFPQWANKAFLDPLEMERLREYIRSQVEYHEPKYTRKNRDGSTMEISKEKNSGIYQEVVEARVTGEIGAFFNPIDYNRLGIIRYFIRTLV